MDRSNEETGLPRATIEKVVHSSLKRNFNVSREVKTLLKESCHCFLNLVIVEANKICEVEKKKIITNQHVYKALEKYEFGDYIDDCRIAAADYDEYSRHKPSRQDKFKESGKTLEELHADQMKLFDQAKKEQKAVFGVSTAGDESEEEEGDV